MKTLQENTRFVGSSAYWGERGNWLIMLARTRDSDCLTESNFHCALSALGGESDHIAIERFHHWAVGWCEYLLIDPESTELIKIAEDMLSQIEDYPVLDESDFSEREQAAADETWRNCFRPKEPWNMMKTTKSRAEQLRAIDKMFHRLSCVCESTHNWDRYVALNEQEEKDHRRFKPDHIQAGLTKAQAVRYFAVKELFERFVPGHQNESIWNPEAKDFFSIRHSVFGACALFDTHGNEILAAISHFEMRQWLDTVDYVELNKDQRKEVEAV